MAPNIRDYTDLVEFLYDFFAFRKQTNSQWSFRSWALNMGFKSHANFISFLNGKRKLTKNMELKLIQYFNFSEVDLTHFNELCAWSRFAYENPFISKKIKGLALVDEDSKQFEIQCSRHSFSPLITLLGEILRTSNRPLNITELNSLLIPDIANEQLLVAIERLIDLGLAKRLDDGNYLYTQTGRDVVMKKECLNLKNSFALNLAANNQRPPELSDHYFVKQAQFRLPFSHFKEFESRLTQSIKQIVTDMWTIEDEIVYDLVFSMQPIAMPHSQLNSSVHQV